jgi:hypothetical protein
MTLKAILRDRDFWLSLIALLGTLGNLAVSATNWLAALPLGIASLALILLLISRTLEVRQFHREKHVPFLIVIGKSDEQYRDILSQVMVALEQQGVKLTALKQAFNLIDDDWIFRRESDLPTDGQIWKDTLHKVERKFWHLAEKIPGRKVYHFFLVTPAAFALGLGALLGARTRYVAYHYQPGTSQKDYHPQVNFASYSEAEGAQRIGTRLSEYRYIHIEPTLNSPTGEIYVALDFVRHSTQAVQGLARGTPFTAIMPSASWGGTIPLQEDWVRLTQEIASALLELLRYPGTSLHLFPGVPNALAFAIGSGLGKFPTVSLWSWMPPRKAYIEALKLHEL